MNDNFKISIIVPLYGRDRYTKIWTDSNFNKEYFYLIADGSNDDENEKIFKNLNLPNIVYKRYKPDNSSQNFLNKMHDISLDVKTDYVMTCDNDDFLNYKGIDDCLEFLDKNEKFISASGYIFFVNSTEDNEHKKNEYKIFPRYNNGMKKLSDSQKDEAFRNYMSNSVRTSYLWYSIYRTEYYKKIWEDIKKSNIDNLRLVEILQTCLTINYGKFKSLNNNHYIRLRNPIGNSAAKSKRLDKRLSYSNDLEKFSKIIMDKFNINIDEFNQIYGSSFGDNLKDDKLYFLFFRAYSRLINLRAYNINTIRKIFNFFVKLRYFNK